MKTYASTTPLLLTNDDLPLLAQKPPTSNKVNWWMIGVGIAMIGLLGGFGFNAAAYHEGAMGLSNTAGWIMGGVGTGIGLLVVIYNFFKIKEIGESKIILSSSPPILGGVPSGPIPLPLKHPDRIAKQNLKSGDTGKYGMYEELTFENYTSQVFLKKGEFLLIPPHGFEANSRGSYSMIRRNNKTGRLENVQLDNGVTHIAEKKDLDALMPVITKDGYKEISAQELQQRFAKFQEAYRLGQSV